MPTARTSQPAENSRDLVMQQSLALRSFLGARAKRRAARKSATDGTRRTPQSRGPENTPLARS